VTFIDVLHRILYGALFVLALPLLLVSWSGALSRQIPLAGVYSPTAGLALAAVGSALVVAGGIGLMLYGRGLPMNAFPPPVLVRRGVFRWLRNPMYIGVVLLCAGIALAAGSAAGLWLVTPALGLGALALIWGYERRDMFDRFGAASLDPPLLSLPRDRHGAPRATERMAVYLWVLIPWLIAYAAVQALGRPPDAFVTTLGPERRWPVLQWTELVYFSAYIFIPITPLVIRSARGLRGFAVRGAVATVGVTLCWLVVPVVADNRAFVADGLPGQLLAFEQHSSRGMAAWPAFHVLWSLLAAQGWGSNARAGGSVAWKWMGWSWAALISASCLTTGMHSIIEVVSAVLFYLPLRNPERTWEWIRGGTERLANSWREWRIGPLRVINHGIWAALGAACGVVVGGSAAGPGRYPAIAALGLAVLLGAGLGAQALEGSSKLLRPFGWYGGVLGGVAGTMLIWAFTDIPPVALLAALSVAAPWIQIFGRIRCLIQGCCHGGPAGPLRGICYRHPRSRVNQLAGLSGVPLHATPLYSITGNLIIGVLMVRLQVLGASDPILLGVYLMLAGFARFVEEAYRAEPQTPVLGGLRLYQWCALFSVAAGLVCTSLPGTGSPGGFIAPPAPLWWYGAGVGLLYGIAMGVDFPGSNRRFSRLAAAD
jgi:protein-S-isoprenylcysteine O-methyltransferase Ste14